jgi:hypothetical protein
MPDTEEVIPISELVNLIGSQQIEIAMLKGKMARLQAELRATLTALAHQPGPDMEAEPAEVPDAT